MEHRSYEFKERPRREGERPEPYTPLSSEKGDVCTATQEMKSSFVKGYSLVSNNEKGGTRANLSMWLLQVGRINTCTVYAPVERG